MLTRRRFLELGAAAYLTVVLGEVASARAAGLDPQVAGYLRRGSWVPLVGENVSVAGVTLQLDEVADLPRLAGRDDAFGLEFTGPAGAVQSGIHEFRQAQLGTFVMFVSPVDTVLGSDSRYEAVVDRSVGVPGSVPTFGSTGTVSAPTTAAASPGSGSAEPAAVRRPHKRTHLARRRRKRRHLKSRPRASVSQDSGRWIQRRYAKIAS